MTHCVLCGLNDAKKETLYNSDGATFECSACGVYVVDGLWIAAKMHAAVDSAKLRRLCGVVRADTDDHGRCREHITNKTYESILARHQEPATPLAQMERFILLAAERAEFVGANSVFESEAALARRIYFDDRKPEALTAFLSSIHRVGYIGDYSIGATPFHCTLTLDGWRLAESLRTKQRQSDKAFVAMWFHPALDQVFDDGFAPALYACGYNAYRVDRDEHNNRIDDRIIANIRSASLVVADLTGMRPNVFYEAGFAHGLGTQLLLTCNDALSGAYLQTEPDGQQQQVHAARWFDQVSTSAFDLRQYNILGWDSVDTLRTRLEARIRAIGLDRKPAAT